MSSRSVWIGDHHVGDGHPCFLIAEAGSNHNGRLEHALKLVDVAADAKADAVKFQVFTAKRLYPKSAGASDYLRTDTSIYDIIAELEMPLGWLPAVADRCSARGIQFLASAFDESSVDALDPFVTAYKIASYELTHYPLLDYVARKGKPVIVSTGAAVMDEVADMVTEARRVGVAGLALMQCTAAYPAPVASLNLRAIPRMKTRFNVPVGLSDHSRGPVLGPAAACALGANLIEKHFTFSNLLPGPDHQFALEPQELAAMVSAVREVEASLGTGEKVPHAVEEELRAFARRSIFTTTEIARGEVFTEANVAVLRCGKLPAGLAPKDYPALLGRCAARNLPADCAVRPDDAA